LNTVSQLLQTSKHKAPYLAHALMFVDM
jgi:hypothetical protein